MTALTPIRLFHAMLSEASDAAALEVLRSGQIASGPKVPAFEAAFGELIERENVVCTNDMTSALTLALHLAGVGAGDEVITLAFSCLASNSAIARLGATATWVDMDPLTASVMVEDFERVLTPRTKAVTLYHVAGYPGATKVIADICRSRGIALIEDCNNALGARQDGRPVGKIGDYAVYSFYPNRQINGIEGGALVCPDAATADRGRRLRRFGVDARTFRDRTGEINPESDVPEIGWSASFNQLNAAVALANLPGVEGRWRQIVENAGYLTGACREIPGITVVTPVVGAEPAYWGFLVLAERRDVVLAGLKAAGVEASKMHCRNDGYSGFGAEHRALPGTDAFMSSVIALPCGWWLSRGQLALVAEKLEQVCRK